MKRFGLFLAGIVMLIVFGIGAFVAVPVFACALVVFLLTGSEGARAFVGFRGKSLDQVFNATYLGGHPKETVSSHAGRWIVSGRPLPLWVRFVRFVTDIAEKDHCVKAIEEPFKDYPL